MSSFVVRTNVNDLLVSVENVERGVVDIFIHGIGYIPGENEWGQPHVPYFYLKHARRGVCATFTKIMEEVQRGVNYHFVWDEFNKKEFESWLETRLFTQDILVDLGHSK